MRHTSITSARLSGICALMLALSSATASANNCGGFAEASNPSDEELAIVFQNHTNADGSAFWADTGGEMQYQNAIPANGSQEFGSCVGSVWYVEAMLDGYPTCLGPVVITTGGECQVDLWQDADQFYISTAGACSN
jgi:hypothetical protein